MNYRHAFHAGNFADVVKHAALTLVIEHLSLKDAPFRVIDTHAGLGLYELTADQAARTGEWRDGIGRLMGPGAAPLPPAVDAVLARYLGAVALENAPGEVTRYPGSPWLARSLLRPGDTLVVNELHPDDAAALERLFARDPATKVLKLDGWTTLKAMLPPKERRGVVLIDPPFEEAGELQRLVAGLTDAVKRFATGIVLLWFPIKDPKSVARFYRALRETGIPKLLSMEVMIRAPRDPDRLNGTGLIILNPPYRLPDQLRTLAPFFAERLAQGPGATSRLEWLAPER